MSFATPIWLLALVPWAALVVWMLWGRRERVGVPFLALWGDAEARPRTTRAVQAPPLPIVLILTTILLAILAAASPTFRSAGFAPVTIVIDRGITMSARDGGAHRYQQAVRQVESLIGRGGLFFVLPVPGVEAMTDRSGLPRALEAIAPSAVDTTHDLEQAVLRIPHVRQGPILVVTDRPLKVDHRRVVLVPPTPLTSNTGITHVAAREKPVAQVMVRVRNQSPATRATVGITGDDLRIERALDLPRDVPEATAFIDLPRLGETVEIALAQGDALTADDRAWLVREGSWPRIEAAMTLPPELERMVEAYRKLRPAREGAGVVLISDPSVDTAAAAVILAPADEPADRNVAPDVSDHAVTSGVAWSEVWSDARVGRAPPRGFLPVVSRGERVAVAVREQPARQVWVALDAPPFPRRADYVIFWTNVFDWLGRGGEQFASHPVGLLGEGWRRITDGPAGTEAGLWPGIYRRGDGTLRAVNAPPVTLPGPAAESDWRARLAALSAARPAGRTMAPYLVLAALACALGAALRWPARNAAKP